MKAYLSYWKGGWQQKPNQFVLNCHKLATFLAKKNLKEVHFLTDSESIEYFKDIPFNSVDIIFDNLDLRYNNVWSASKIIAYEHILKKGDPFIHIDYDVFLWAGIPERIKNAAVFGQCEEHNSYYWYGIEKYIELCPAAYIIGEVNPKPLHGINVGIFGGNNLNFIKKYIDSALSTLFDKRNEEFFFGDNVFEHHWNRAVIVEQYNLAACCQYYGVKPELYFPYGWPSEIEASAKYYTHLMGSKHKTTLKNKMLQSTEKLDKLLREV